MHHWLRTAPRFLSLLVLDVEQHAGDIGPRKERSTKTTRHVDNLRPFLSRRLGFRGIRSASSERTNLIER
jgi:hypothetical protein